MGFYDLEMYGMGEGLPVHTYNTGETFNVHSFITQNNPKLSYKSLEQSTIYTISRSDFMECLKTYSEDNETWRMIYNQVVYQG